MHSTLFRLCSCLFLSFWTAAYSNILEIKPPTVKERVAAAGIIELPKVSTRQITLSAAQKKYYTETYKNFKFKDESRYVKGIPLGITGIFAMDSTKRQDLFVYFIHEKCPAAGKIKVNDIIVGANGRLFEGFRDCRIIMGLSLAESQTAGMQGKLHLHLMRHGNFQTVILDIGTEIPYSKSFPFNCKRSKKMADEQIKVLKGLYKAEAKMGADWWNVLMLLASDDPEAQHLARRAVYELKEPVKKRLSAWYLGYELIILAEYYLQTGDSTILESIVKYKEILEMGQCPSGGWGHGLGLGGYGEVNACGLTCLIGLILAEKCLVKMHEERYQRSINYFKKFRSGTVPYGNHPPKPYSGSNNGKGGMAAVAFDLLGDRETSRLFATPTCYSFNFREGGHAEGLFQFAWGPLGAIHATQEEFELFMRNQIWYYELGRKLDGRYTYFRGGRFAERMHIGGVGLFLMMPEKSLQIMGAKTSVFSKKVPAGAEKAAKFYKEKRWPEFLGECSKIKNGLAASYAGELKESFETMKKNAAFTIAILKKNIQAKNIPAVIKDHEALKGMLGPNWPGLKEIFKQAETAIAAYEPPSKKKRYRGPKNVVPSRAPNGGERDRRRVVLNGWTPGDAITLEMSNNMKKLAIVEVVRQAVHPNQSFASAAQLQILSRKSESKPLIEKLLNHKDPNYRALAVRMLGAFEKGDLKPTKWNRNTRNAALSKKPGAELQKSLALIKPLLMDPSIEVQMALPLFCNAIAMANGFVNDVFLKLSKSQFPKVITAVLKEASVLAPDEKSQVNIGLAILQNSKNIIKGDIAKASALVTKQKDYDLTPHFKQVFYYLREDALFRKGLPDVGYASFIKIFQSYPDNPLVKDNIALFCQLYVRKQLANIEIRSLFEKMDRKLVVSVIRKKVYEEEKWLNDIVKNHPLKFKTSYFKEEFCRAALDELKRLADDLASGKKIDHHQYDKWADELKYKALSEKRARFLKIGKSKKK